MYRLIYVQHSSDQYMLFCHDPLPLVVKHCSKSSKPLGTPSKLTQILGDGNCLFRALSDAVTGRQIYYTRVRAQIINHMRHIENFLLPNINSSLDSYLANDQMFRNKVRVRVRGIEILRPASLLFTDIFVQLHPIWGYIQMAV